jgi:hypothetical protein
LKESDQTPRLERGLGVPQAIALNVANIVGIGPFITIPGDMDMTNARPRVQILAMWLSLLGPTVAAPDEPARQAVEVQEYAPKNDTFHGCTHLLFRDTLEIVTTGRRFHFRRVGETAFRESPLTMFDDAHAVVFNARDQLYYATDTANHRLFTFRDPTNGHIEQTATTLAGVKLDRPHDIVVDPDGWLYALNPNKGEVFRFRGFGDQESLLDLSQHIGYSRSLTVVGKKLYVVGPSAGKIVEVDNFERRQFRVHTSFGKRRDAPAGSWQTTGLVPNDVDFHQGYWYVTSYFCPAYSQQADCNQMKFIRFKIWKDFETGNWEDLSSLLPRDLVPYYLTPHDNSLYLAAFSHEAQSHPGRIYRVTHRQNN